MDIYMEKPGQEERSLSHLSIHQYDAHYAVEEVVGTVDQSGRRHGEIVLLAADLSKVDAERRYRDEIEARKRVGFRPASR